MPVSEGGCFRPGYGLHVYLRGLGNRYADYAAECIEPDAEFCQLQLPCFYDSAIRPSYLHHTNRQRRRHFAFLDLLSDDIRRRGCVLNNYGPFWHNNHDKPFQRTCCVRNGPKRRPYTSHNHEYVAERTYRQRYQSWPAACWRHDYFGRRSNKILRRLQL